MSKSNLERLRAKYVPELPPLLQQIDQVVIKDEHGNLLSFSSGKPSQTPHPLTIGVLFSGGQAPGGHNVICSLFDAMQSCHPHSRLFGFLDGPKGLIENKSIVITQEMVLEYRNMGGFDMIGSGRTKIATEEQFTKVAATCEAMQLDGVVIIGGDDSNTNASLLAQDLARRGKKTRVVGVPKTIDGDLRNEEIEASFGFDTATKIYAELIGNLAKDALSAKKYTHFVRLMGRSASHVTLECALQTAINLALIGEEVQTKRMTLEQLVTEIADLVEERSHLGKNYGVVLIPEGLIEFIPEFRDLIEELNAKKTLSSKNQALFDWLPTAFKEQLLSDLDPHGNVQLSHIETEKLLISLTQKELRRRGFAGPFHPLAHFFGYEGRAAMPSNFDVNYCAALGLIAFCLIRDGHTGYIASIRNLAKPVKEWVVGAAPLAKMLHKEMRKGKETWVIAKKLVELNEGPFLHFANLRQGWRTHDDYMSPGPIQFHGENANDITQTLRLS